MAQNIVVLMNQKEGKALIKKLCQRHRISFPEFEELVQVEVEQVGKAKKKGMWDQFDEILDRLDDQGEADDASEAN